MLDVWINCPHRDVARAIARALLDARLCACANIWPDIESWYHWKGSIETAREVPLLVRTRAGLFAEIVETVRGLHPYEVPSIHAVEAACVTADYLAWLENETVPPEEGAG